MRIIIEGEVGSRDIVLFGKNWGWLRGATIIKGKSTKLNLSLDASNAFSGRVSIPGPIDAKIAANVDTDGANLVLSIVSDKGGTIIWQMTERVGVEPRPFSFRVYPFRVEGTVRVVP